MKTKMTALQKYLAKHKGEPVNSKRWEQVFKAAEDFEEIKHPGRYEWHFVVNVPIGLLNPPTVTTWEEDPDLSEEDVEENLERYSAIEKAYSQGAEPWPIIVDKNGLVLDGYHRLAVLNDNGVGKVDVLWPAKEF